MATRGRAKGRRQLCRERSSSGLRRIRVRGTDLLGIVVPPAPPGRASPPGRCTTRASTTRRGAAPQRARRLGRGGGRPRHPVPGARLDHPLPAARGLGLAPRASARRPSAGGSAPAWPASVILLAAALSALPAAEKLAAAERPWRHFRRFLHGRRACHRRGSCPRPRASWPVCFFVSAPCCCCSPAAPAPRG